MMNKMFGLPPFFDAAGAAPESAAADIAGW
jgi:hypothetical protein